jgi:hypothetical protein
MVCYKGLLVHPPAKRYILLLLAARQKLAAIVRVCARKDKVHVSVIPAMTKISHLLGIWYYFG